MSLGKRRGSGEEHSSNKRQRRESGGVDLGVKFAVEELPECEARQVSGVQAQSGEAKTSTHYTVLKRSLESLLVALHSFFVGMSNAVEFGVPDLARDTASFASAGEKQEALACDESPITHVDESQVKRHDGNNSSQSNGLLGNFGEDEILSFIASLPPLSSILNRPQVCIPPKSAGSPRCTLVLDLDETLVHCSTEELENADGNFPVFFKDIEYKVFVRRRPHLNHFLSIMSGLFEVIVFTASHRVYADRLLDILDPENKYFDHRVFRESCVMHVGNYVKDLTVLGRDLAHTVIIDNSPQAFGFHVDNGIPISTWIDKEDDDSLLQLIPLLRDVAEAQDVRSVLSERIGLSQKLSDYRQSLVSLPSPSDFERPLPSSS